MKIAGSKNGTSLRFLQSGVRETLLRTKSVGRRQLDDAEQKRVAVGAAIN
jgi:hypothetical protein